MSKEDCPRDVPHKELESNLQSLYGGACKRLRDKALLSKCISEDTFKKMEFCNLVPRCLPSQGDNFKLWSWTTCKDSPILSMSTPFAGCERCLDCDFVKNCSVMEGSYLKDLPYEMDFTVRYQFQCKTELGIPVNNIGLATENGFKLFEQTLDGSMTLTGKKYLSLTDLNPVFTREAGLDVNCELSFFEPVKMKLSAHSRETLEKNWDDLRLFSEILGHLLAAQAEIQNMHGEKGKSGIRVEHLLADVLAISTKFRSDSSTSDATRQFLDLSIKRIQDFISMLETIEGQDKDFYEVLADLREDLDKRVDAITEKIGKIYARSIEMLRHDSELSAQFGVGFDEVYRSSIR